MLQWVYLGYRIQSRIVLIPPPNVAKFAEKGAIYV